jgi:hypothetical protein
MFCEPETQLIERMEAAGVSRRMIAKELKRSYSIICSYLNGFSPLPRLYRHLIEVLIDKAEKAAGK